MLRTPAEPPHTRGPRRSRAMGIAVLHGTATSQLHPTSPGRDTRETPEGVTDRTFERASAAPITFDELLPGNTSLSASGNPQLTGHDPTLIAHEPMALARPVQCIGARHGRFFAAMRSTHSSKTLCPQKHSEAAHWNMLGSVPLKPRWPSKLFASTPSGAPLMAPAPPIADRLLLPRPATLATGWPFSTRFLMNSSTSC